MRTIKILAMTLLAASESSADNRCDGDACGVVTSSWDRARQRHVFHNGSNRPVSVVLDGMFTGQNTLHLRPGGSEAATFLSFRMPYHARYDGGPPRPAPPPATQAPAITRYHYVNKSRVPLYLYFLVTGPGNVDCKSLIDGGTVPPDGQKTIVVRRGQIGWLRFQLVAGGGCDSRKNKFDSHIGYDPARLDVAITIP